MSSARPVSDAVGVVCAIPARYGSIRLPGKALLPICGRPMIEHVYRRASEASGLDAVVVLTDHEDIRRTVEGFGGCCEMTPADCRSGTDRIAWAARNWRADAVINVQGDEPLLDPSGITHLAEHLRAHTGEDMATLAAEVGEDALRDPNQVKVVCGGDGYALYFSRAGIPYRRRPLADDTAAPVLLHVGVYGYRRNVLLRLAELEASPLERSEKLEQLRALENGIRIRVLPVDEAPLGVDTAMDLALAERRMLAMQTNENREEERESRQEERESR